MLDKHVHTAKYIYHSLTLAWVEVSVPVVVRFVSWSSTFFYSGLGPTASRIADAGAGHHLHFLALEFFAKMLHTSFVPIPPKELGGVIVSSLPYYNDNSFDRSQGYKHFCLVVNFCTCIGCYQSCLVAHQAAPISHCFWKATTHFLKHTFWPIWDVPAARHVVIYDKWDNWNRLACPRRNNRGYCHILEFYFPYPNLYNPGWVCRFQGINNLYRLSYTCWIFFFILATLMQIANCGAAYFTVTIALHTFSSLVLRMRQSVVHCRSTMIIGWIFAITVGKWIG